MPIEAGFAACHHVDVAARHLRHVAVDLICARFFQQSFEPRGSVRCNMLVGTCVLFMFLLEATGRRAPGAHDAEPNHTNVFLEARDARHEMPLMSHFVLRCFAGLAGSMLGIRGNHGGETTVL